MFKVLVITVTIFLSAGMGSITFAQENGDELDNFLEQVGKGQAESYLQPLASGLGASMNSDLYHTAATHAPGGFDITLKAMVAKIPTDQLKFTANLPAQTLFINGQQIFLPARTEEWSTVLGPERPDNLPDDNLNPGGIDFDLVPFAVPQLSVGLPYHLDAMIRFFSYDVPDLGTVKVFGIGGKHNLKRHFKIPTFPDLSIQYFYQTFDVGDFISAKTWALNLHVSKSIPILTGFAGVGIENTNFEYDYTLENDQLPDSGTRISGSIDTEMAARFVAGIRIKLGFFTLNGSLGLGKLTTVSGGLGITFR